MLNLPSISQSKTDNTWLIFQYDYIYVCRFAVVIKKIETIIPYWEMYIKFYILMWQDVFISAAKIRAKVHNAPCVHLFRKWNYRIKNVCLKLEFLTVLICALRKYRIFCHAHCCCSSFSRILQCTFVEIYVRIITVRTLFKFFWKKQTNKQFIQKYLPNFLYWMIFSCRTTLKARDDFSSKCTQATQLEKKKNIRRYYSRSPFFFPKKSEKPLSRWSILGAHEIVGNGKL